MTDAPSRADAPPIDVLVVATWFPAYDDLAAGRFVADQAEALAATGAARPAVISFDGIRLSGGASVRGRQAQVALEAAVGGVHAASPLFVAPAVGVEASLPVARLSIPEGQTPDAGVEHAAVHREAVLAAAADRLASPEAATAGSGIVHAHTVYPDGAAAALLADRLGWPLLVTEHSSFVERIVATPGLRERYAATLGRAFRVLAVSEMLAGELRTAFPEQAAKIDVLPNTVPMDLFRPAPLAGRAVDELLFVGYRKATKGIENLLRAVAVARDARPTVRLRLLGKSPDRATEARWQALAADLGIGDAVSFEEPIDRSGIADAMARASLFVHPSPRETFGVVAVEALASGTPVVATDSGGVTEILGADPERLGAIVPVDDPAALGAAIVSALERRETFDPDELRASVERRFGSAFVAERLLVLYREAIALAGDAPARSIEIGSTVAPGAAAAAAEPWTLVVALDRERAALRLGPLPDDVRRRLTLVTAAQPAAVGLPSVGLIVEVDVEPGWRPAATAPAATRRPGLAGRLARLVTDPRGTLAKRMGRGPGSDSSLEPATRALREVLTTFEGDVRLVPLDGHDHLAAAPLVRSGAAKLADGGLRRLADLRLAAEDLVGDPLADH